MRGAVGEVVGLAGTVLWGCMRSCLSYLGLSSFSSSPSEFVLGGAGGGGGTGSGSGGGGGGGGGKRHKGKKSSGQAHLGDAQPMQHRNIAVGIAEADRSMDFVAGKLTFHLFPNTIRSQALHIQQMRTSDMYRALEKAYEASPSSQMLVAILATILLLSGWLFALGGYAWLLGNGGVANDAEYQTVESNTPNFGVNPNVQYDVIKGHYWRDLSPFPAPPTFDVEPPSWVSLMFLVVTFGTASSLFLYGRIMLPIPEFVAGTNVLKAIRAETRILGGGTGGSTGKTSKLKDKDLPWAENYKSITTENRLRLYYKVAVVRILENIYLCSGQFCGVVHQPFPSSMLLLDTCHSRRAYIPSLCSFAPNRIRLSIHRTL
jgi:hypothetical protein